MAASSSPEPLFDASSLTADSLDAFLSLHPSITRIDAFPSTKVLLSALPPSPSQTLLISGGGDGHQPAHAGYIGQGMLTAAVSGDVFASPPSSAILSCIRSLPTSSPLLLIVKNYTGDRLNFGLALQQAQDSREAEISMVIVGDDVAMERDRSAAGRRGLAGTVLVHKLAGAAAAEGRSLKEVKAVADDVSARLCSLGVAFSGCRLPGQEEEETEPLRAGEMEVGLGIHGEPGVARQPVKAITAVVQQMLNLLLSTSPSRDYFHREAAMGSSSSPVGVVLLVNNLSAMLQHEMSIVAAEAAQQLRVRGLQVERAVTGALMTAMAMRGFSLTLLRLPADGERKAQMLRWLDAPTTAPAWPSVPPSPPHRAPLLPLPRAPPLPSASASSSCSVSARQARAVLSSVCHALISAAPELDALDRSAGDGDCGSTLRGCAAAILADLGSPERGPPLSPTAALLASLRRYTAAMGGTTGAVYSLILSPPAAATSCSSSLPQLLLQGVSSMQQYSGAREGDRTMVDALLPALRAYIDCEQRGGSVLESMQQAVAAGRQGMEATKAMKARAGRASYVRDAAVVEVDPGAKAVVIALQAALDSLRQPH